MQSSPGQSGRVRSRDGQKSAKTARGPKAQTGRGGEIRKIPVARARAGRKKQRLRGGLGGWSTRLIMGAARGECGCASIRRKMPEPTMPLAVTPITPAVGAEVSNVDLRSLTDGEFAQIEQAWNRHAVLLFRGQTLSDDDLLAFSRRFGELDPPPNQEHGRQSPPGYPDVYVVSNVLDEKGAPIGALGSGEAVWHTDMSYADVPPDASML